MKDNEMLVNQGQAYIKQALSSVRRLRRSGFAPWVDLRQRLWMLRKANAFCKRLGVRLVEVQYVTEGGRTVLFFRYGRTLR